MKTDTKPALSNRNGALDFLKFAASVILVLHHYQQVNNVFIDNGVNFYSGHFYWGFLVELFFLLSGFCSFSAVTKILDGQLEFKKYYLQRCTRLLPLVSAAGVIYYLVNNYLYFGIMGEYYLARSTGRELILTFLGIQVSWASLEKCHLNPPMWYISSLLIGCVYLYLATKLSRKAKAKHAYVYILITMIFIAVLGDLFGIELPFYEEGARRSVIGVFLGVLLAIFLNKHTLKGIHYIIVGLMGICGAGLYLLALSDERLLLERYALSFLFFPAVIIIFNSPAVNKLFSAKIWNILGGASFDTYVLHVLCLLLLKCADRAWGLHLNFENWWLEYLTCLVIFGIGLLSYRFVEPNLKKLGEKFISLF